MQKNKLVSRSNSSIITGISLEDFGTNSSVQLALESRFGNCKIYLEADAVARISYKVSPHVIKYLESSLNVPLADCSLASPDVDILIGGQHANKLLLGNKKFFDDLCLEETKFGWIAQGPFRYFENESRACHLTIKVEDSLSKFWEV